MRERITLRTEPAAERAVIGAVLLSTTNGDDKCRTMVFGRLADGDVFDPSLRVLFAAGRIIDGRGDALEHTLWLREVEGRLTRDEAATLLIECGHSIDSTANAERYVELVAEAARQRRLVCAANDALNAAASATHPIALAEVIDDLASRVAALKAGNTGSTRTICVGDVEAEPVEWLWPGRIAIGKVTLFAGDPGLGKSLLAMGDMAARVSRGAPWPDAPGVPQPAGGVILCSAEDDLADTIRPRLDAHDADVRRVFALQSLSDLARDIDQLRTAIDRTDNCRLIVVDPISAYMGRADSHVNADVRATLAPLAELATEKRVAIVAVTHLRKGEGAAMYRAMGSLAFVAAARAAWAVVRDRENAKRRLVLPIKNNLAGDTGTGLAYTIESNGVDGAPVVCWEAAPVTITADEAMAPEPRKHGPAADDRERAEEWLRSALADGPRPAKELNEEAREVECLSQRTVERARQAIGVEAYRPANPGPWYWRLQEADRHTATEDPHHKQLGGLGGVPKNPEFFDRFEDRKSTPPSYQNAGAAVPFDGLTPAERRAFDDPATPRSETAGLVAKLAGTNGHAHDKEGWA